MKLKLLIAGAGLILFGLGLSIGALLFAKKPVCPAASSSITVDSIKPVPGTDKVQVSGTVGVVKSAPEVKKSIEPDAKPAPKEKK